MNGTRAASSGVCRPIMRPSRSTGICVEDDSATTGSANVPKATGTESATSAQTAALIGGSPTTTSIAPQIATGAPAPIRPSRRPPKP